jgi:hypothetical protein
MNLADGGCGQAASPHLGVTILELLRQEPVDPLAAPARMDLVLT